MRAIRERVKEGAKDALARGPGRRRRDPEVAEHAEVAHEAAGVHERAARRPGAAAFADLTGCTRIASEAGAGSCSSGRGSPGWSSPADPG